MVEKNQIKTLKPWGIFSRLFFLLVCLSFFCPTLFAQNYFEFTPACRSAYDAALSLRFEAARKQCDEIRITEPNNLIVYLVEDYIDFFTVFINENYKEFSRLEYQKDLRLQKIRSGDSNSPFYKYCQAEINLHWALARLKFEEYFSAFLEVKNAYKLLTQNQEEFPDFIANKKSLGVLHAMVGTIPDSYKWGVKLLGGMEGTIEEGLGEIEAVIAYTKDNDFIFREETGVMYAFLMLHLKNNWDRAWKNIVELQLNPEENPLAAFAMANIAMRTGRNDQAIDILQQRPQENIFAPFPYLNYMLGLAKLYRQDDDASIFLQKYIDEFRGVNYIKEAYQKMAWQCVVKNDIECYHEKMKSCLSKGGLVIGGDKMAMREAENGQIPNAILIKARLLFDGGYYDQAAAVLNNQSNTFLSGKYRLEYLYRLGRIYQSSNQLEKAKKQYQLTIDEGANAPEYYACNAALQMGIINEQANNVEQARRYFEKCLDMRPDEYRSGLHQKAKAGLGRIKRQ